MDTGHRFQKNRGFTLIEILVVLVIIGITVGLVQLNVMPDDAETLKAEVNRFGLLVEQAANEARASGRTHACIVSEQGYHFEIKQDDGKWVPVVDDILRPRQWPQGMLVTGVEIDGQKAIQGQRILLSSSGYNSIFVIAFTLNDQKLGISGTTTGRVRVQ